MSTSTTTTTTTTMRRTSVPVLLESFPIPPSHIPQATNPPPTGPPSLPLPPLPGPSRVSVDEQLLFFSSVATRSRRSSKYSVTSSHRESVISIGSVGYGGGGDRRTSVASGSPVSPLPSLTLSTRDSFTSTRSSPRSSSFCRPAISVSAVASSSRPTPGDQLTRLSVSPMLLSDIEDDETEVIPSRMPSPFLDSSWRRSKHQHNESISSIDVRSLLGVDADGTDELVDDFSIPSRPLSSTSSPPLHHEVSSLGTINTSSQSDTLPTPTFSQKPMSAFQMLMDPKHQVPISPAGNSLSSPSSDPPSSPLSTVSKSSADQDLISSPTVKDLRLDTRAERTESAGLQTELAIRSQSRVDDRSPPPHNTDLPPVLLSELLRAIPVTTASAQRRYEPRKDEMTLEELKVPSRSRSSTVSSTIAFPTKGARPSPQTEKPRTPSPDIDIILSKTPRPALWKSTRPRVLSQGIIRKRIDSSSNSNNRRRASEGVVRDRCSNLSYDVSDLPYIQRYRTWSRSSHRMSAEGEHDEESECKLDSEDETADMLIGSLSGEADGNESDSSIDLHTPLPHLMVRDGLLSPHSRLLPSKTRRSDGRSDSIMTISSVLTKTGIMKDERDTPMRRVRHRDNRLLKGGIGLTTGLGWSDSEDEDAPSPLTRRLSCLNLSRRSSASSVRTSGSIANRRHPLSRSYSSGALLESEQEHLEDLDEDKPLRPRSPSGGRFSKSSLPPTSWINKGSAQNRNSGGTRTSTSSIGSSFSVDTTLSDGAQLRTSKLGWPGSGLRESSASSSENYGRVLARKRSAGVDRTSSSTGSTASIGMPSTPRDYDPALSSPAGLGIKLYDKDKSLPPLPPGRLKKRPSYARLDVAAAAYNFPRARTFSSTSSATSTPSPPTSAIVEPKAPVVRPLRLPRQAARSGGDRAAVPVPSVLSTSGSQSSLRSTVPRSPNTDNAATTAAAARPRPRTGTGMAYRTSSGSRRGPITLSTSTSVLGGGGLVDAAMGSPTRIPPL